MALNFDPLTGNLVVTPERASYSKKSEAKAATKVPPTMRGIFTPFGYVNSATGENFSLGTFPVGLKDQIGPIDIKNQGRFTPYGFNPNVPAVQPGEYQKATRTTPIVTGLTPDGEVDRTQSDEYKATRARYDQLRKAGPEMVMTPEGFREKAVDYGLQEWAKMYPKLAERQQKGSFNPLMKQTFGYQTGEGPGQLPSGMAPDQETVMGDLGSRAQGEGGYDYEALMAERARRDMESPDPLVEQEMQQRRTADQARKATTAGMSGSALDRTDQFLTEFGPFFTPEQTGVKFPDPSGMTPGINPDFGKAYEMTPGINPNFGKANWYDYRTPGINPNPSNLEFINRFLLES